MKDPNRKFEDSATYNFLMIFIGLFFAFFITIPDGWHKPLPLIAATAFSGIVAFFVIKFNPK